MPLHPEPELATLIAEAIDAGLLKHGTSEHKIACLFATKGQGRLTPTERRTFEERVLPILSKPIETQIFIQSLARRANRVPRRVAV